MLFESNNKKTCKIIGQNRFFEFFFEIYLFFEIFYFLKIWKKILFFEILKKNWIFAKIFVK
jgi:hypothetical protein